MEQNQITKASLTAGGSEGWGSRGLKCTIQLHGGVRGCEVSRRSVRGYHLARCHVNVANVNTLRGS
jgi:hypothetical protein